MPLPDRHPGAVWRPSPNLTAGRDTVAAVVVHISEGSYEGGIGWLTSPSSQASAHFFISSRGDLAQLVSLGDTAWANGLSYKGGQWRNARGKVVQPTWELLRPGMNPNRHTVSVELAGFHTQKRPAAQLAALHRLLRWVAEHTGLRYEVGRTLIGHRHLDNVDRANCPGPHVDLELIAAVANGPSATPPTAGTPILGGPMVPATTLIAYLDRRAPHLTWQQRQSIVTSYTSWGELTTIGNVRPLAQAIKEASEKDAAGAYWAFNSEWFLTAWNPAGIGVTGAPGAGHRFPSIAAGIAAQFAHLLCYAAKPGDLPRELATLQLLSPRREALAGKYGLGVSPTWEGLNGKWADPGPTYGQDILRIADEIAGVQP
jgi:hypothetical protein